MLSAGGGWLGAGITGQYFNNTTLSGSADFSRSNVRLDFPQGTVTSPAGFQYYTHSGAHIGETNWSAKWNGSLVAKYSETYTLKADVSDAFTLQIAAAGTNNWTNVPYVFNIGSTGGNWTIGTFTFTAGTTYAVNVTLVHGTGAWGLQLHWLNTSGPNPFAEEAIEPATPVGADVDGDPELFANADVFECDKYTGAQDAQGNPTSDCTLFYQYAPGGDSDGDYLVTFTGEAALGGANFFDAQTDTTYNGNVAPTAADAASLGWSNVDTGMYNAATNTTTIGIQAPGGIVNMYLGFHLTQRTQTSGTGTGFSNLQVMAPTSPGATTYYPVGTEFTPQGLSLASNFTVFRFEDFTGYDSTDVNWSQAPVPGGPGYAATASGDGAPWQYAINFCNATGKDMYVNIPVEASDAYATSLADAIKYGSDADGTPYTGPQANPVWAPLNPNLNVYIELSDEMWNWGLSPSHWNVVNWAYDMSAQMVSDYNGGVTTDPAQALYAPSGSPNAAGQFFVKAGIGQGNAGDNWTAYRIIQISNDFRSVCGAAEMPGNGTLDCRIRPVLEWQAGAEGNSEASLLPNIWEYYSNSSYVAPEPVNYYLWGGGSAFYSGPPSTFTGSINDGSAANVTAAFDAGVAFSSVNSSARACLAYGLQDVAYEGGYDPGNGNCALGTAMDADPRSGTAETATLTNFYQSGGVIPIIYEMDWRANWALVPELYTTATSPRLTAVEGFEQSLPPAVNVGEAPGYVGSGYQAFASGSRNDSGQWYSNPPTVWLVTTPGTYDCTVSGSYYGGQPIELLLNGQPIGIATDTSGNSGSITIPVEITTPGDYVLSVANLESSPDVNGSDQIWWPSLEISESQVSAVDLFAAYNREGIVTAGATFSSTGGFDGAGNALSGNALGVASSSPGLTLSWNGNVYQTEYYNTNNVVSCSGQTIALPQASFSALSFLAAAADNQQSQIFTVTYTDGSTQQFIQSFSNWTAPQSYGGESIAATMTYRDTSNGGTTAGTTYLYGYTFNLNPAKLVASITLPNDGNLNLVAADLLPSNANLAGAYNREGIVTDGTAFSGTSGLDAAGNALSANLAGTTVTCNSVPFTIGAANANNVVSCQGQTVPLPEGNFSTLSFLAAAIGNQTSQTFTVNYVGGGTQQFTQSFSSWTAPQAYSGESTVLSTAHFDHDDGTVQNSTRYVYGYSFTLNSANVVQSITLPSNGNIEILAMGSTPATRTNYRPSYRPLSRPPLTLSASPPANGYPTADGPLPAGGAAPAASPMIAAAAATALCSSLPVTTAPADTPAAPAILAPPISQSAPPAAAPVAVAATGASRLKSVAAPLRTAKPGPAAALLPAVAWQNACDACFAVDGWLKP